MINRIMKKIIYILRNFSIIFITPLLVAMLFIHYYLSIRFNDAQQLVLQDSFEDKNQTDYIYFG